MPTGQAEQFIPSHLPLLLPALVYGLSIRFIRMKENEGRGFPSHPLHSHHNQFQRGNAQFQPTGKVPKIQPGLISLTYGLWPCLCYPTNKSQCFSRRRAMLSSILSNSHPACLPREVYNKKKLVSNNFNQQCLL